MKNNSNPEHQELVRTNILLAEENARLRKKFDLAVEGLNQLALFDRSTIVKKTLEEIRRV